MKFSLETTGPSRLLWFVLGAVTGFLGTAYVVIMTIFALGAQGIIS